MLEQSVIEVTAEVWLAHIRSERRAADQVLSDTDVPESSATLVMRAGRWSSSPRIS